MTANMQQNDKVKLKHVFICGLQRSGTSVLARNIGRMGDCTAFRNTGVLQDEGQYLQDVYATDHACGGTGRFGFNPRAHLTEASPLLTPENIARLKASWERYWDPGKSIRVEKTPKNLLMTRFLQSAFPNSYFVVIKRHPVAVSMANQRWKKSMASLRSGFEHWLHCYGLYEDDKKHLERVYELRYEDYISDPARYHREIAEFVGTTFSKSDMEEVADVHNRKYLDRWRSLMTDSPFRKYYRYLAAKYEARLQTHGYSLTTIPGTDSQLVRPNEVPSDLVGEFYCGAADFHALCWRVRTMAGGSTRRLLRRLLPSSLKERIKVRYAKNEAERVKRSLA